MIYTIGHSTHSIENFIKLLKSRGITAIADVRSAPYSRFQPQFNRELLTKSLKDSGIEYVFVGDSIGGRSSNEDDYENEHQVEYKEEAIQLIKFEDQGFKLNPEALEIISSIEDDLVVVAVIGKARTGKSYLMNLLLDNIGKNKGVGILFNLQNSFK